MLMLGLADVARVSAASEEPQMRPEEPPNRGTSILFWSAARRSASRRTRNLPPKSRKTFVLLRELPHSTAQILQKGQRPTSSLTFRIPADN